MDYSFVDQDRTAKEVVKTRVVDTAVVAYQHDLELRRLKAHADAGDAGAKLRLPEAAATALRHRRRASRAAQTEMAIDDAERAIQEGLFERMRAIKAQAEGSHAQHSQLKAERERVLEITGELAPSEAETAEIESNIAIHDAHIRDANAVHSLVSRDLEDLEAVMAPDEPEADTSDADVADALAAAEANRLRPVPDE